jgi:hypothetical protein
LNIHGVRQSTVAALKARYRGTDVRLEISGAKGDTWLRANLDNPFRGWVNDNTRGGEAACKAYAKASRAMDKLGSPPPAGAEPAAQAILHALIDALNAIDGKHLTIDTLRREEAGDAFHALAARAGISTNVTEQWFDEWRDF